jgi:hypothetical protein
MKFLPVGLETKILSIRIPRYFFSRKMNRQTKRYLIISSTKMNNFYLEKHLIYRSESRGNGSVIIKFVELNFDSIDIVKI